MCMKEFDAEKIFLIKWQGFERKTFSEDHTLSIIVHTLCNQLLSELMLDSFNILHTCYRPSEHVHEEVDGEKLFVWQNGRVLNLAIFWRLILVNNDYYCILCVIKFPELLLNPFNVLHTCYWPIESVHEEVWCWFFVVVVKWQGFLIQPLSEGCNWECILCMITLC